MPKHKAQVGSISQGTLRAEDLLAAFSAELSYLIQDVEHPGNKQTYQELIDEAESDSLDYDIEEAGEILGELILALKELAPPYCYFGAHEGDGSDFGFWPCMDSINELPRLKDDPNDERSFSDQAKSLGEDCVFVNDHGNVTVYGGDGSVILELV